MTTYIRATPEQDGSLRTLLRENGMASWVTMATTREPSFFAGLDRFGDEWAVVASQATETVGMYTCSAYPIHLNGRPISGGYLGGLRVARRFRNRVRLVRDGFASVRSLAPKPAPQTWYTCIASQNIPARRLLEANLQGMPHYCRTNEFITLAVSTARGCRRGLWRQAAVGEADALCRIYNREAARFQFSPVLTPDKIRRSGARYFRTDTDNEKPGCMALWNQQSYKQVVATAYRRPLDRLLPLYNVYARYARRVPLPPVGQTLDQTYLAFLAVAPGDGADPPVALLEDALSLCPTSVMTFGLHADHPWLDALVRAFRPATYRTVVYSVSFEIGPELDGRPAQPEVALL